MKKKIIISLFILSLFFFFISIASYYVSLIYKADQQCADTNYYCSEENAHISLDLYSRAEKIYKESWISECKALLYFQLQDYKSALKEYQNTLKYVHKFHLYEFLMKYISFGLYMPTDWNLKSILIYYQIGNIATKLEDYNLCVDSYTEMYKLMSSLEKQSTDNYKRGYCYYKLENYDEALKDYIYSAENLKISIENAQNDKLKSSLQDRLNYVNEQILLLKKRK